MDIVNVGLVGYGKASQIFHAPLIESIPHLNLKVVVERHQHKSKERYPYVSIVKNIQELLSDSSINLVVIATPNDTHYSLARKSLLAGKHVVVDKPFTVTSEQGMELVRLADQRNLVLSVFQNRRWDGDFKTVRELLKKGMLGRLVEYESHFDRYRKIRKAGWREDLGTGTGILYDLGSHLIDQTLILFGLPEMVTADLRMQRETARVVDNFELILHYPDLKVTLKAGMLVREPQVRFVLHGTEGSYVKYGLDPQEEALKEGGIPGKPGWGEETPDKWGLIHTDYNSSHIRESLQTQPGSYQDYYINIARVIKGEEDLIVYPQEAVHTIRIIELALESHDKKCTVPFSRVEI